MAFGLSFGTKKQTTDSTSNINKTENTNQQQTGTNTSSGTSTSNSNSSGTSSTVGQQTTSQTGSQQTTGTQTGTTKQTTSAFSDSTLSAIEKAVGDLFGKVGGGAPISAFNKEGFIADGVGAATRDILSGLDSNVNQLTTNLGGTSGSNSMAALLENRMRGDAAAEVQGVRTNLTAQAEQIARDNILAQTQVAGQDQGFLGNLLAALKGGQVTTTGTESSTTAQNQTNQTSGTQTNSEQTQQQQTQQQVQTQQLIEMMEQLLKGTTNTVGTETTKGTTKQSGGGFSLAL